MSVETIKQELTKMTRDERRSVGAFLASLDLDDDEDLRAEITRRLNVKDEGYWVSGEELRARYER